MRAVADALLARGADVRSLRVDLSCLTDTRRAAQDFLASGESLHLLINNAGIGGSGGSSKSVVKRKGPR